MLKNKSNKRSRAWDVAIYAALSLTNMASLTTPQQKKRRLLGERSPTGAKKGASAPPRRRLPTEEIGQAEIVAQTADKTGEAGQWASPSMTRCLACERGRGAARV